MAFKIKAKNRQQINVKRVVVKFVATLIMLWIGGTIVTELGNTMIGTCSPFNRGFTLIGWNLTTPDNESVALGLHDANCEDIANTIDGTGGGGVLTIVGIIGLASIVLEFVDLRF